MRARVPMLLAVSVALSLTVAGGCGGGGPDTQQTSPQWSWSGPSQPLVFPTPTTVEYVNDSGELAAVQAPPGFLVACFTASTEQAAASTAIADAQGELLDMIPERRCCLVGVAPGDEGRAIEALRATGLVDHASPNVALEEAGGVVAVESCSSDHARQVRELLSGCAPSIDPESPSCADIKFKNLFGLGLAAAWATLTTDSPAVINVSQGVVPPRLARFENLTEKEQANYLDSQKEFLADLRRCARLGQLLGREVVFVVAAGNYAAPLEQALAAVRSDPEDQQLFAERIVLVGAPSLQYANSNLTASPDPDVVLLDNADTADHTAKGTSFAAPRVSAMLRKVMREQGIGAAAALAQLKAQAAGGTVLKDPCGRGVPDLTGARFYRPGVTDGHYIRFERRHLPGNPEVLTILQGTNTLAESVSSPGTIVLGDLVAGPMWFNGGTYDDDVYLTYYWVDGVVNETATTVTASADGRVVTYNWGLWHFTR